MEIVNKWGFGMAPFKASTESSYKEAIVIVKDFVSGNKVIINSELLDSISSVKGLFNRIVKENQWDWFTVNMYFDYPQTIDVKIIVSALVSLRNAILHKNNEEGKKAIEKLVNNNFMLYCSNFIAFDINKDTSEEYLYILSRKEEKEILKIGMTTRNIQKRVNEINSATGVLFPYSARKVYKVKNSRLVEKNIHMLLSQYRIRSDREFFRITFSEACSIIEKYLETNDQYYYN